MAAIGAFMEQAAHLPQEEREAWTNAMGDQMDTGEPPKDTLDVQRSVIVCRGQGQQVTTEFAMNMSAPYTWTGEVCADSGDLDCTCQCFDSNNGVGSCEEAGGTLFCTDDTFADEILSAGLEMQDALWRLPLHSDYRRHLDSPIADINNIGGRFGGAITAALFLREFVGEGRAWAHIDTMAWNAGRR